MALPPGCSALLVVSLAGCAVQPHAHLVAPAPGAPSAQRLAAYQRLRALDASETVVTDANGDPVAPGGDFVILAGGDVVYHAEDLLPVVPADSATARAAARSAAAERAPGAWQVAGLVVATIGLGLATFTVLRDDDLTLPAIGLGLTFAGTGLVAIPTIHAAGRAEDERISAFASYDRDLRQRLAVCARGLEVVACDAPERAVPGAPNHPNPARNPELDTSRPIQ